MAAKSNSKRFEVIRAMNSYKEFRDSIAEYRGLPQGAEYTKTVEKELGILAKAVLEALEALRKEHSTPSETPAEKA